MFLVPHALQFTSLSAMGCPSYHPTFTGNSAFAPLFGWCDLLISSSSEGLKRLTCQMPHSGLTKVPDTFSGAGLEKKMPSFLYGSLQTQGMFGDTMNGIAEEPDVLPSHKPCLADRERSHWHPLSIFRRDSAAVVCNKIPGLAKIGR